MYVVLDTFTDMHIKAPDGSDAVVSFQSMILGSTNPVGVMPVFHTAKGALDYIETLEDKEQKLTLTKDDKGVGLVAYNLLKERVHGKTEE